MLRMPANVLLHDEQKAEPEEPSSVLRRSVDQRPRAERREVTEVPWVSTVKLPWGLEVRLLNISSSGLLLESGSKLAPGSVTELKLCGPDTEIAIPACFVRTEVADVTGLGVKYHIAATFDKPLEFPRPHDVVREIVPPRTMSALLMELAAELASHASFSRRHALERAVREVVAADDVRILTEPFLVPAGADAVSFAVPRRSGSPAVLQARFVQGTVPSELQRKLLRAAAGLAAVVMEFDEPL